MRERGGVPSAKVGRDDRPPSEWFSLEKSLGGGGGEEPIGWPPASDFLALPPCAQNQSFSSV